MASRQGLEDRARPEAPENRHAAPWRVANFGDRRRVGVHHVQHLRPIGVQREAQRLSDRLRRGCLKPATAAIGQGDAFATVEQPFYESPFPCVLAVRTVDRAGSQDRDRSCCLIQETVLDRGFSRRIVCGPGSTVR
jgi:hypothetical protein